MRSGQTHSRYVQVSCHSIYTEHAIYVDFCLQIKRIEHENINRFIGVSICYTAIHIVTSHCSKGTLRVNRRLNNRAYTAICYQNLLRRHKNTKNQVIPSVPHTHTYSCPSTGSTPAPSMTPYAPSRVTPAIALLSGRAG